MTGLTALEARLAAARLRDAIAADIPECRCWFDELRTATDDVALVAEYVLSGWLP